MSRRDRHHRKQYKYGYNAEDQQEDVKKYVNVYKYDELQIIEGDQKESSLGGPTLKKKKKKMSQFTFDLIYLSIFYSCCWIVVSSWWIRWKFRDGMNQPESRILIKSSNTLGVAILELKSISPSCKTSVYLFIYLRKKRELDVM